MADLGEQRVFKRGAAVLVLGDDSAVAGADQNSDGTGVHFLAMAAGQHEGRAAIFVLDGGRLGEAIQERLDELTRILGRVGGGHVERGLAPVVSFNKGLLATVVEKILGDVQRRGLGEYGEEDVLLRGCLAHDLATIFEVEDAS